MAQGILIEGLIYGIMVLGVFATFRVLNFCDMTVDGSFPMGACVLAACIVKGISPSLALIIATLSGILAGLVTTIIYTKFKIPDLLSGILTMTMLYSINLRIMDAPTLDLLGYDTAFTKGFAANIPDEWGIVITVVIFVVFIKLLLDVFYHTDMGLTMGALGSNAQMVISQGVNPDILRGIGVCLGNSLAALSGALWAMYQGFAAVGSGTGVVVSGLASLMLGEFVLKSNKIILQTFRVLIGSIIYRALMYLGRNYGYLIGMKSDDINLLTGILIILCLLISHVDIRTFLQTHLTHPDNKKQE